MLPKGLARWPLQRDRGQCFIQVKSAVADRTRAMRRLGESYSAVILRLVETEAGERPPLPPEVVNANVPKTLRN